MSASEPSLTTPNRKSWSTGFSAANDAVPAVVWRHPAPITKEGTTHRCHSMPLVHDLGRLGHLSGSERQTPGSVQRNATGSPPTPANTYGPDDATRARVRPHLDVAAANAGNTARIAQAAAGQSVNGRARSLSREISHDPLRGTLGYVLPRSRGVAGSATPTSAREGSAPTRASTTERASMPAARVAAPRLLERVGAPVIQIAARARERRRDRTGPLF